MNERLLVALPLPPVNPSGLALSRVKLLWLGKCRGLVAIRISTTLYICTLGLVTI